MMPVLGRQVTVVSCASSPGLVGTTGTVVLESMRMLTIVSQSSKLEVPKRGTALRLEGTHKIVVGDEMLGRLEERISKGARV